MFPRQAVVRQGGRASSRVMWIVPLKAGSGLRVVLDLYYQCSSLPPMPLASRENSSRTSSFRSAMVPRAVAEPYHWTALPLIVEPIAVPCSWRS